MSDNLTIIHENFSLIREETDRMMISNEIFNRSETTTISTGNFFFNEGKMFFCLFELIN